MPNGTPFKREFILVLEDGRVVLDWGDGLFQDLNTGDFLEVLKVLASHKIENPQLELLIRAGRVERFNRHEVIFLNLPERPSKMID
ncbi:MAG TPA: hypothetical protein VF313_06300 [Anaerolineaceae bacterium]